MTTTGDNGLNCAAAGHNAVEDFSSELEADESDAEDNGAEINEISQDERIIVRNCGRN
jgi:hypothetical protein